MIKRKQSKKRKNPQRLKNIPWEYYIPLDECIPRHIYYTAGRGITFGVYKNDGIFIGIRDNMLVTEYHWDLGGPMGTVRPVLDLGILPENIKTNLNDTKLFDYLEYIENKFWPLIWPEEESRKKKFYEEYKKEQQRIEKEFGSYKYYCDNCGYISDKIWGAKCPQCKIFGSKDRFLLRLKDNTLWRDFITKKK